MIVLISNVMSIFVLLLVSGDVEVILVIEWFCRRVEIVVILVLIVVWIFGLLVGKGMLNR